MNSLIIFALAAFLLGLLFGSFLNVCIARLPKHESLWAPRSHCPHCGATIRWYDNIPLLSWVLLQARCRLCKGKISWRYPAVELAVGLWWFFSVTEFMVRALNEQNGQVGAFMTQRVADQYIAGITAAILGFLLIGLLVMDWQTHKLPDAFTFTGIFIGFILICVQAAFLPTGVGDIHFDPQRTARLASPGSFVAKGDVFMTGPEHLVLGRVLAIILAGSVLLLVRWIYLKLRGREGLGLGDAKLLAMIAAFLGFWPAMLSLFIGVVLCSAYAVTLMARRKATAVTRLPLGTFLCIGGMIAMLFGDAIIAWYTTLLSTSAILPT